MMGADMPPLAADGPGLAASADARFVALARGGELILLDGALVEIARAAAPWRGDAADLDFTSVGEPRLVALSRGAGGATLWTLSLPRLEAVARTDFDGPRRLLATAGKCALVDGEAALEALWIEGGVIAQVPMRVAVAPRFACAAPGDDVAIGRDDRVELWDAAERRVVARVNVKVPPSPHLGGFAARRRLLWIASSGAPGQLRVLRFSDGILRGEHSFDGAIVAAAGHPDGSRLVLAVRGSDGGTRFEELDLVARTRTTHAAGEARAFCVVEGARPRLVMVGRGDAAPVGVPLAAASIDPSVEGAAPPAPTIRSAAPPAVEPHASAEEKRAASAASAPIRSGAGAPARRDSNGAPPPPARAPIAPEALEDAAPAPGAPAAGAAPGGGGSWRESLSGGGRGPEPLAAMGAPTPGPRAAAGGAATLEEIPPVVSRPREAAPSGFAPPSPRSPDDYLARALELLEAAIRRRWADGLLTRDADGIFTSVLGAEHVEQLLRAPAATAAAAFRITDQAWREDTPFARFVTRRGLSPTEADLLAVLLAAETDPSLSRLIAYLGGNQAQHKLTTDLVFELVYRPRFDHRRDAAARLLADLAAHRALRRLRLILVEGAEASSALAQQIRIHPRLTAWLLGQVELDAELLGRAALLPPGAPESECDPQLVEATAAALRGGGRLVILEGPPRSGRELVLRAAAAELGRPLLVVSGRGLTPDLVTSAFREALLQGALLALRDVDAQLEPETRRRLGQCLEVFPATVALLSAGNQAPQFADLRPLTSLQVNVPGFGDRLRLWRTALQLDAAEGAPAIGEVELASLAALYNLGTSGVLAAASAARERAAFEGRTVVRGDVTRAVRELFETDLAAVANRASVTQTWDDVVLTEELGQSVVAILDRIRHRSKVLGEWGFARKVGKGLGVTVLFSGEPGTGKSMVAALIAKELDLDLYVVDLARVTSKWLGETEKNLGRAFDAAEAGHAMLLFDEADTILGKRSDVRSANDRHANLETNFVLNRLEQFQGIAFFTTNLASAIDGAVARRMSARVTFPFPDVPTRAELWRRMIPREAPTDGTIDFQALAQRYEISGGFIRNIVLRAAYAAAREGTALGMAHLEQAARGEYTDRGALIVGGRLV